jgi:hypothetical protein
MPRRIVKNIHFSRGVTKIAYYDLSQWKETKQEGKIYKSFLFIFLDYDKFVMNEKCYI